MPTTPGPTSQALTPQQTLEKVSGLITDLSDDTPDESLEPAATAAPAPEQSPPEPSDTPPEPPADDDDETPIEVKVNGELQQVTLADLKRSYSSAAHNTQRAQELSEKEKHLESSIRQRIEAESLAERHQYQQGLAQLRQALEQLQGEPDWLKLRTEVSDAEFLKQKADWEATKAHTERLRREEQRVAELNQAEQGRQFAEYLRGEEDKLRAAVPEWADVEKGKAEIAKIRQFAQRQYGVPEDQLRVALQSATGVLVLRDAMRYRELHREPSPATRTKVSGIKTAKPGTPARPRPNAVQEKLLERVATTHRSMDAMKAIESLLPD